MTSDRLVKKLLVSSVLFVSVLVLFSGFLLTMNDTRNPETAALTTPSYSQQVSNMRMGQPHSTSNPLQYPTSPIQGLNINPYSFYSSEPAPMGLADYGLYSSGIFGSAYYYFTPSFLGTVSLDNLNAINATNSPTVTFQLNVNMYFVNAGSDYTYWIQDVFALDTLTDQVQIIDNVWNASSSSPQMYNSSISGSGTLGAYSGTHFYYDFATNSLPGNLVGLKYPATVELMVNSTISGSGIPGVSFMYNDGYGWISYDKVTFPFAKSMSADDGFVVDGQVAEPNGDAYDAELILGGPGGGSSTEDISSEVNLSLQFWNGNNFQEIPSAFNFGSHTAETSNNVVSSALYYVSNGALFEQLSSGSGSLAQVYSPADIAFLNIDTTNPYMAGTLYINGTAYPFVKGDVNLTLAPGNYNAAIYIGTMLYNEENVSLSAGQYLSLHWYENLVLFTESGLPQNAQWWVNISHRSYSGTGNNAVMFYVSNGTYQYTLQTSNKDYSARPASSEFSTNGAPLEQFEIKFSPVLYDIVFTESGLATGVSWTVSQGTTSNSSSSASMNFYEMNGTYQFLVANLSDYYTGNYSESLTVHGYTEQVDLYFNHYAYITGSLNPSTASLYVDGKMVSVSNGHFNVSVTAGIHSVNATSSGYDPYRTNVSVISGEVKNLQVSLSKISNPLIAYALIGIPIAVIAGIILIAYRRMHNK